MKEKEGGAQEQRMRAIEIVIWYDITLARKENKLCGAAKRHEATERDRDRRNKSFEVKQSLPNFRYSSQFTFLCFISLLLLLLLSSSSSLLFVFCREAAEVVKTRACS